MVTSVPVQGLSEEQALKQYKRMRSSLPCGNLCSCSGSVRGAGTEAVQEPGHLHHVLQAHAQHHQRQPSQVSLRAGEQSGVWAKGNKQWEMPLRNTNGSTLKCGAEMEWNGLEEGGQEEC